MIQKQIKILTIIIALMLVMLPINVSAVETDDIEPYQGTVNPTHWLYNFKLMMENIDESFTFNQTRKMEKKLEHADLRIAEMKYLINTNETDYLDYVGLIYNQKIVDINRIESIYNVTGLENAQLRLQQHQLVLQNVLEQHNTDVLSLAIQNAETIENRFIEQIQQKVNR